MAANVSEAFLALYDQVAGQDNGRSMSGETHQT